MDGDEAARYLCTCAAPVPHVPPSGAYFAGECATCRRLIRGGS